jgi:hypothetical protein
MHRGDQELLSVNNPEPTPESVEDVASDECGRTLKRRALDLCEASSLLALVVPKAESLQRLSRLDATDRHHVHWQSVNTLYTDAARLPERTSIRAAVVGC